MGLIDVIKEIVYNVRPVPEIEARIDEIMAHPLRLKQLPVDISPRPEEASDLPEEECVLFEMLASVPRHAAVSRMNRYLKDHDYSSLKTICECFPYQPSGSLVQSAYIRHKISGETDNVNELYDATRIRPEHVHLRRTRNYLIDNAHVDLREEKEEGGKRSYFVTFFLEEFDCYMKKAVTPKEYANSNTFLRRFPVRIPEVLQFVDMLGHTRSEKFLDAKSLKDKYQIEIMKPEEYKF